MSVFNLNFKILGFIDFFYIYLIIGIGRNNGRE